MTNEIIVRCGGSGLRVIGSPLYLEDKALTQRVTALDGSSLASVENGQTGQPFPAVHFFSIPKHLLEVLWLEEIPKLTGLSDPRTEAANNSETWPGLDTLAVLLETIDDGFIKPIDAVFQSSAQSASLRDNSGHDICNQAVTSAPRGIATDDQERAAWLNLDEHSHRAHVRVHDPKNGSSRENPVIELEIARGEGILWRRRLLQVTEAGSNVQETSNKLILLSGRKPDT